MGNLRSSFDYLKKAFEMTEFLLKFKKLVSLVYDIVEFGTAVKLFSFNL